MFISTGLFFVVVVVIVVPGLLNQDFTAGNLVERLLPEEGAPKRGSSTIFSPIAHSRSILNIASGSKICHRSETRSS
jgi:hypothetical protein